MILTHDTLFGRHASERKEYVIGKLLRKEPCIGIYLIKEASPPGLYEIYNHYMFLKRFPKDDIEIKAVAYGYQEALELSMVLVKER